MLFQGAATAEKGVRHRKSLKRVHDGIDRERSDRPFPLALQQLALVLHLVAAGTAVYGDRSDNDRNGENGQSRFHHAPDTFFPADMAASLSLGAHRGGR